MLQIVIHCHDQLIFRGADTAKQRIVLAIVAHQVETRTDVLREDNSEITSQLPSWLPSLTRLISYSVAIRGNTKLKRWHSSAMEASPL